MKITHDALVLARATRDAAARIEEWQWPRRTHEQWVQLIQGLGARQVDTMNADADLFSAKLDWDKKLAALHTLTSALVRLGRLDFAGHRAPVFDFVKPDAKSRVSIAAAAERLTEVWRKLDENWVPRENLTLEAWENLVKECTDQRRASVAAEVDLLLAGVEEQKSAADLDDDCVAWYTNATLMFPEDTAWGDFIRRYIPTAPTQSPPGEAKITSLTKSAGGKLRAEFNAKHGTSFTLWQLAPGQPEFAAVVRETKDRFAELTGLSAGEHRFKLEAHNSRGTGPMSQEVVITLAPADVAAA